MRFEKNIENGVVIDMVRFVDDAKVALDNVSVVSGRRCRKEALTTTFVFDDVHKLGFDSQVEFVAYLTAALQKDADEASVVSISVYNNGLMTENQIISHRKDAVFLDGWNGVAYNFFDAAHVAYVEAKIRGGV